MVNSSDKTNFKELGLDTTDPVKREILSKRINELPLKIQGTKLEVLINQLYQELANKGISFKPKCYLTDEWGCPHGIPVIGIPFYLADPKLSQLEGEITGIEAENDEEIMAFLRHESGHAFNYAHRLYLQPEWRGLFGLFNTPYKEDYKPNPFSSKCVRHLPGWYSQKHPDEDFAETFAVWLKPDSDWKKRYEDTPALTKLLYIERIAKEYGNKSAVVTEETLDAPIEELNYTLVDWYDTSDEPKKKINLPVTFNEDLKILFPSPIGGSGQSVTIFLNNKRYKLSQEINNWTGIEREIIEDLIDELAKRAEILSLKIDPLKIEEATISVTAFITTLVMNYLFTDNFVKL